MNQEPSVLDYLKSRLNPRKYGTITPAPVAEERQEPVPARGAAVFAAPARASLALPWRSLLALALALLAQRSLEPAPDRTWQPGLILYLLAVAWLMWAYARGEWLPASPPSAEHQPDPLTVRRWALLAGIPFVLLAYLTFTDNLFTRTNVILWLAAIALLVYAFWLNQPGRPAWLERLRALAASPGLPVTITRWTLAVLAVTALVVFFRAFRLAQVPPEMNSDHAEKLLDVWDVLHGQTHIFFPRNTGREFFQFYLTAAVIQVFGTGISFLSLKLGTLIAGLLTLPYIYLLGKETGNREAGLWAAGFAGISYWGNVITRIALRFTLYPFFAAPALFYLVRGLRRANRNDFILSGIALGIGLHGYTPIRILPFVFVAAVVLFLLHRQSEGVRQRAIIYLGVLALISLVLFLPLLRFAQENPDLFAYRAFTRLGDWERPLPGPAGQIFVSNLKNAMLMMNWDDGEVWTTSVPHRPVLDVVSGALFVLGFILVLVRYMRRRHWLDLFLLLTVPMLMLPSILSLAFPAENPVPSRTGGALIPVFLLVGIAMEGLLSRLRRLGSPAGARWALALGALLLAWSSLQNYDLVFRQYYQEYLQSSWNTSEMGAVIKDFAETIGTPDSAWVMGYPYWVDTRLVGMNAGTPDRDTVMTAGDLALTAAVEGPKLFLVKPEDEASLQTLRLMYPNGTIKEYHSQEASKDFLMFFVMPQ